MKKFFVLSVLITSLLVSSIAMVSAKELASHIMVQDNFQSGLGQWKVAINAAEDRAGLDADTVTQRVQVVDAPGMPQGHKAVQFVVPHTEGQFRSEIAQPHEEGFHERWYAARVYIPQDWVFDTDSGNDIFLQWHAILGNERVDRDFPNLSISVDGDKYVIKRSFGSVADIQRDSRALDQPVQKGVWSSWVVHARWSSASDGQVEVWKDGKSVWKVNGPNAYTTRPRTPYFKTGIYHPQWKLKYGELKTGLVKERKILITDVKIGNEQANYNDMMPKDDLPKE
ncbi:polysaccharide lyase [Brevibacillus ginsengisoli]|uniref:polysaccharide lyase n=1 Tax=Brevibacillus ginsengisoli TaxID=363854 RepID=UPI003CE76A5D